MSGVARAGAAPAPSIAVTVPSGCRMTHQATPPRPLVVGSTTPIANAAATAASTALPPSRRIRAPASAARGCSAVIIAPVETASLFLMSRTLRVAIAADGGRTRGRASAGPVLPANARPRDALDELPLGEEEQHGHRRHRHDRAGHQQLEVGAHVAAEDRQSDLDRPQVGAVGD